jgi:glycosyltransferase involved in cell wall biosynthesis
MTPGSRSPPGASAAPSRLALFVPSLRGGGAERVMVLLANAFAAERPVDLVVAAADGPLGAALAARVRLVDLSSWPGAAGAVAENAAGAAPAPPATAGPAGTAPAARHPRGVLAALPRLVRYLACERPAAMLATLSHANVVAVLARRLAGSPTRLVLREGSPLDPPLPAEGRRAKLRALRLLVRWVYPQADRLVANAPTLARELADHLAIPHREVAVLPNPLDREALRFRAELPVAAADLPAAPDGPLLVAAGRLVPQKDFAALLHAFAHLCSTLPARLVILGEGPLRRELVAAVHQLGLDQRVRLPGFREQLPAFLRDAAAFVLPSRWEGTSNALLEAWASGVTPVLADFPGAAETLLGADGAPYGLLAPATDPAAFASALAAAVRAPLPPARLLARAAEHDLARVLPLYRSVLGLEDPA